MSILEKINSPHDLSGLTAEECNTLCAEIREFLIQNVAETGGHLASNLGTVELTLALHLTFDLARDKLVFDVGHQCYTHKILTGRRDAFPTLRKLGGLSGFPKPAESEYDAFIAGHASNSISAALGLARARSQRGEEHSVLALIGDGALTGGMAYEALCDAGGSTEPVIAVLNDNGMSITENVGGMARYLSRQRIKPSYLRFKKRYRRALEVIPGGRALYKFTHNLKAAIKRVLLHCSMFEEMGFEYLGPVDGHDIAALRRALEWARNLNAPVLLHVVTQKGRGYELAERSPDAYHGVSHFDPRVGVCDDAAESFSSVFGQKLTELARDNPRIVAVTAAMMSGTGLESFAQAFPTRVYDVGIAEEHAAAMTAGLAAGGMLPVLALYSTFLQRSYDQLLHDIALMGNHCVLAIDRAGIVTGDGETHQGIFDVAFLSTVPNVKIYAPASFAELRDVLTQAICDDDGVVAIRYQKGAEGAYTDGGAAAVKRLRDGGDVTLVTYGAMTSAVLAIAERLAAHGVQADVIKLGVIAPIDMDEIRKSVAATGKIVIIEDSAQAGAVGERIAAAVTATSLLLNTGAGFLPGGSVAELRELCGLDEAALERRILEFCNG